MIGSFVRISDDGGFSWGKTVKVPVSVPHWPVVLKDDHYFMYEQPCTLMNF